MIRAHADVAHAPAPGAAAFAAISSNRGQSSGSSRPLKSAGIASNGVLGRRARRGVALVAAHHQPVDLLAVSRRAGRGRAASAAASSPRGRNGSVTRYWCDIGTIGMRTPASRPISAANIPPQLTTTSHSMSPRSVRTAAHPSAAHVDPVTRVCRGSATPPAARQAGQRVAQLGRVEVAVRLEVRRADHARRCRSAGTAPPPRPARSRAAAGRRSCPADLAADLLPAARGLEASLMPPLSVQPSGCSPRCSRRYSSTEYMFIRVSVGSARSWPTSPAEWNVEPLVSSSRSTTTTSRSPARRGGRRRWRHRRRRR